MIEWGMSKNGHDWSISVFDNDTLLESFSGKGKSHPNYAVAEALSVGVPDIVIWYENPYLKGARQFLSGQRKPFARNNISKYLKSLGIFCEWTYVGHHQSHASHFYKSGFENAMVLVIDSIGEFDCTSIGYANENVMNKLYSETYPDSLGLFYSAMTQYVGLTPQKDEGEFEKLALKGKVDPAIVYSIENDLKDHNFHHGLKEWKFNNKADIAASTQFVFEKKIVRLSEIAKELGHSKNLVVSGGCAFNRGIRPYLDSQWNTYYPPNPSDSSSSETAVLSWLR